MAFLDNLGKKIGDIAQTTAKKSSEMIEVTKLNMAINSAEDSIKKIYVSIGEYTYKQFEDNALQDPYLLDLSNQIKAQKDKIAEIRQKINEVKNISICSSCGAEVDANSAFCAKCGNRMEVKQTAASEGPVCPNCKAQVAPGAAFCNSCGAKQG
ncbi:MAG TPA: hypothetical protein DD727_04245 [Clostridiales bacterium]|nr:hypothetical protein [Clostridiales bacterium]